MNDNAVAREKLREGDKQMKYGHIYRPWSDVKEPHYHNKEGKKLYYVSGLGWNTKEWVSKFLENWNRAVKLWDNGYLFNKAYHESGVCSCQQEYARTCCSWIIPNGMVEPHCVAEGL